VDGKGTKKMREIDTEYTTERERERRRKRER
jgi:hypothetical protein